MTQGRWPSRSLAEHTQQPWACRPAHFSSGLLPVPKDLSLEQNFFVMRMSMWKNTDVLSGQQDYGRIPLLSRCPVPTPAPKTLALPHSPPRSIPHACYPAPLHCTPNALLRHALAPALIILNTFRQPALMLAFNTIAHLAHHSLTPAPLSSPPEGTEGSTTSRKPAPNISVYALDIALQTHCHVCAFHLAPQRTTDQLFSWTPAPAAQLAQHRFSGYALTPATSTKALHTPLRLHPTHRRYAPVLPSRCMFIVL